MYRYYFVGVFLLICIYLLLADTFSKKQGLHVTKDSQPWHFSYNPKLHKKTTGLYEFDKSLDTFFDIDIHDLDIQGGYIELRKGRVCSVWIYNIDNVDKKKLDTIVNRIKQSTLSKGLIEEYYNYIEYYRNEKVTYLFSSEDKGGRSIYIVKGLDSFSINITNIHDGCATR